MSVDLIKTGNVGAISNKPLSSYNVVLLQSGEYTFEIYSVNGTKTYACVNQNDPSSVCLAQLAKLVGGDLTKDNLGEAIKKFKEKYGAKYQPDISKISENISGLNDIAVFMKVEFVKGDSNPDTIDALKIKLSHISSGRLSVRSFPFPTRKEVVVKEKEIRLEGGTVKVFACDFASKDITALKGRLLGKGLIAENTEPDLFAYLEAQGGLLTAETIPAYNSNEIVLEEENGLQATVSSRGVAVGNLTDDLLQYYSSETRKINDFWKDPGEAGASAEIYKKISKDVKELEKMLKQGTEEKALSDVLPVDREKKEVGIIRSEIIAWLDCFPVETRRRAILALACVFLVVDEKNKDIKGVSREGIINALKEATDIAGESNSEDLKGILSNVKKKKIVLRNFKGYALTLKGLRQIILQLVYAYQYTAPYLKAISGETGPQELNEISAKGAKSVRTRLAYIPSEYPQCALKLSLRGLGRDVSSPVINGSTPEDIRIYAEKFEQGMYRLKRNWHIRGLLALEKLKDKLEMDRKHRTIVDIVIDGGTGGEQRIGLSEYALMGEVGAALLKYKKDNGGEDADLAIEALSFVFPKEFWGGKVSEENANTAVKKEMSSGISGIEMVRPALTPEQRYLLKKFANDLEDPAVLGKIGRVMGTGNLRGRKDIDKHVLRNVAPEYAAEYNKAMEVIRSICFPFTLYTVSPTKKTKFDVLNPFPWKRGANQKMKVNGADVSPQIMLLKGMFFDGSNPKMYDGENDLVREFNDLSGEEEKLRASLKKYEDGEEGIDKIGILKYKGRYPERYGEYISKKEMMLLMQLRKQELIGYLFSDRIDLRLLSALKKNYKSNIVVSEYIGALVGLSIDIELPEIKAEIDIFKKDPWGFIEKVLKEDVSWTSLECQPGEPTRTQLAKMLLTKLIYSVNLSEAKVNVPAILAGAIPGVGPDDLVSAALFWSRLGEITVGTTEDGKLSWLVNTSAISVTQNINNIAMMQAEMPVSSYMNLFVLKYGKEISEAIKTVQGKDDIEKSRHTDRQTSETFIEICEGMEVRANSDPSLKATITAEIKNGRIRFFRLTKDGNIDFRLAELKKLKLEDKFVLYDPAHAGGLRDLSQAMLDAWAISALLEARSRGDISYSEALSRGAQVYLGGNPTVDVLDAGNNYDPTVANFVRTWKESFDNPVALLQLIADTPEGILKEAFGVLSVPYQMRYFVIQNLVSIGRLAEALKRGDMATVDDILRGTTGADQQDGLAPQLNVMMGSLINFSFNPIAGVDFIKGRINSGAPLGQIIGSSIFWAIWEIQILTAEAYMARNVGRYMAGKPMRKGRSPFIIQMASAVKPVRSAGTWVRENGLDRLFGNEEERKARIERYRESIKASTEKERALLEKPIALVSSAAGDVKNKVSSVWERTMHDAEKFKEYAERPRIWINSHPFGDTIMGREISAADMLGRIGSFADRGLYQPFRTVTSGRVSQLVDNSLIEMRTSIMFRWMFPGYWKNISQITPEIADATGVDKNEITNKTVRNTYGGDHKKKARLTVGTLEAEFDVEVVQKRTQRSLFISKTYEPDVKLSDGDRRCEAYLKRLNEVVASFVSKDGGKLNIVISGGPEEGYEIGKVRVVEGDAVSMRAVVKSGAEVVEISIGRKLLGAGYRKEAVIEEIKKAAEKPLAAQKLIDPAKELDVEAAKKEAEVNNKEILEGEIKPVIDGKTYKSNYAIMVEEWGKELAGCKTEAEKEAVYKNIKTDFENKIAPLIDACGRDASAKELLKSRNGDLRAVLTEDSVKLLKNESLKKLFQEILMQQRASFQIANWKEGNNGHDFAPAQVETIASGMLNYSNNKECGGGKQDLIACINNGKIGFADALDAVMENVTGKKINLKIYSLTTNETYSVDNYVKTESMYRMNGISVGRYVDKEKTGEKREHLGRRVAYIALQDMESVETSSRLSDAETRIAIDWDRDLTVDEGDRFIMEDITSPLIITDGSDKLVSTEEELAWGKARRLARVMAKGGELFYNNGQFTAPGLEILSENGCKYSAMREKVANCLQAVEMINSGKVYVDRIGRRVLIVDEKMGKILKDNRFEKGLHQALEAVCNFPIRRDMVSIVSTTTIKAMRRFRNAKVLLSGTLGNKYVMAVCKKLGIKIIIQGENITGVDIRGQKSPDAGAERAKLEKGIREGAFFTMPVKGEETCFVKVKYDSDNPRSDEFIHAIDGQTVKTEKGDVKIKVVRIEHHPDESVLGRKAIIERTVKLILKKAGTANGKIEPILVQYQGDHQVGKEIERRLNEEREKPENEKLRASINEVVGLYPENESLDRREVRDKVSIKGRVTIASFERADDIRIIEGEGEYIDAIIIGRPRDTWTKEQVEKRVARWTDPAGITYVYDVMGILDKDTMEALEKYQGEHPDTPLKEGNPGLFEKISAEIVKAEEKASEQAGMSAVTSLWKEDNLKLYTEWFQNAHDRLLKPGDPTADSIQKVYSDFAADTVDALIGKYDIGGKAEDLNGLKKELAEIFGAKEVSIEGSVNREALKKAIIDKIITKYFSEKGIKKAHLQNIDYVNKDILTGKEAIDASMNGLDTRLDEMRQGFGNVREATESKFSDILSGLDGSKMQGTAEEAFKRETRAVFLDAKIRFGRFLFADLNSHYKKEATMAITVGEGAKTAEHAGHEAARIFSERGIQVVSLNGALEGAKTKEIVRFAERLKRSKVKVVHFAEGVKLNGNIGSVIKDVPNGSGEKILMVSHNGGSKLKVSGFDLGEWTVLREGGTYVMHHSKDGAIVRLNSYDELVAYCEKNTVARFEAVGAASVNSADFGFSIRPFESVFPLALPKAPVISREAKATAGSVFHGARSGLGIGLTVEPLMKYLLYGELPSSPGEYGLNGVKTAAGWTGFVAGANVVTYGLRDSGMVAERSIQKLMHPATNLLLGLDTYSSVVGAPAGMKAVTAFSGSAALGMFILGMKAPVPASLKLATGFAGCMVGGTLVSLGYEKSGAIKAGIDIFEPTAGTLSAVGSPLLPSFWIDNIYNLNGWDKNAWYAHVGKEATNTSAYYFGIRYLAPKLATRAVAAPAAAVALPVLAMDIASGISIAVENHRDPAQVSLNEYIEKGKPMQFDEIYTVSSVRGGKKLALEVAYQLMTLGYFDRADFKDRFIKLHFNGDAKEWGKMMTAIKTGYAAYFEAKGLLGLMGQTAYIMGKKNEHEDGSIMKSDAARTFQALLREAFSAYCRDLAKEGNDCAEMYRPIQNRVPFTLRGHASSPGDIYTDDTERMDILKSQYSMFQAAGIPANGKKTDGQGVFPNILGIRDLSDVPVDQFMAFKAFVERTSPAAAKKLFIGADGDQLTFSPRMGRILSFKTYVKNLKDNPGSTAVISNKSAGITAAEYFISLLNKEADPRVARELFFKFCLMNDITGPKQILKAGRKVLLPAIESKYLAAPEIKFSGEPIRLSGSNNSMTRYVDSSPVSAEPVTIVGQNGYVTGRKI
jgi:hypothetical protein